MTICGFEKRCVSYFYKLHFKSPRAFLAIGHKCHIVEKIIPNLGRVGLSKFAK